MFEDILGELDEIVGPLEDDTDIPRKYRKKVINEKLTDHYNKIIEKISEKE